jgi:low affinity Fe/Cu permease
MRAIFDRLASGTAHWAGKPGAFLLALIVVLVWGGMGPLFHYSDTWQLVINTGTTIVTFMMVFLIQNSQNRDGAAIQVKLDELIRSIDKARNDLIGLDLKTEAEIEAVREEVAPHV